MIGDLPPSTLQHLPDYRHLLLNDIVHKLFYHCYSINNTGRDWADNIMMAAQKWARLETKLNLFLK
jgi:hypothetical protein